MRNLLDMSTGEVKGLIAQLEPERQEALCSLITALKPVLVLANRAEAKISLGLPGVENESIRSTTYLGNLLRKMRISQGLTQKQVGEAVGTTKPVVSLWESGLRRPSYKKILALGDLLGPEIVRLFEAETRDELAEAQEASA